VVSHVTESALPDHLFVEEATIRLLERCAGASPPPRVQARTARAHRDIAEASREVIARHLTSSLSLSSIAVGVGVSPFHLARVFRMQCGSSVHEYVHQLRLRTALSRVMDGEDLTRVALDMGYASHSHFTARFRRVFGSPPSSLRR